MGSCKNSELWKRKLKEEDRKRDSWMRLTVSIKTVDVCVNDVGDRRLRHEQPTPNSWKNGKVEEE